MRVRQQLETSPFDKEHTSVECDELFLSSAEETAAQPHLSSCRSLPLTLTSHFRLELLAFLTLICHIL